MFGTFLSNWSGFGESRQSNGESLDGIESKVGVLNILPIYVAFLSFLGVVISNGALV